MTTQSTCCEKCDGLNSKQSKQHPFGKLYHTCSNSNCPCHTQSTELEKIVEEFKACLSNYPYGKHHNPELPVFMEWPQEEGDELSLNEDVVIEWLLSKFQSYAKTKVNEALKEERFRMNLMYIDVANEFMSLNNTGKTVEETRRVYDNIKKIILQAINPTTK